jgi:phage-related protein
MTKWEISYYNEKVAKQVANLPSKIKARYFALADEMMNYGPNLGLPHTRAMGDGLFELRIKAAEGIARAFYCTVIHHTIEILHVFIKKSQKTPLKEIEVAKKRLRESRL